MLGSDTFFYTGPSYQGHDLYVCYKHSALLSQQPFPVTDRQHVIAAATTVGVMPQSGALPTTHPDPEWQMWLVYLGSWRCTVIIAG